MYFNSLFPNIKNIQILKMKNDGSLKVKYAQN